MHGEPMRVGDMGGTRASKAGSRGCLLGGRWMGCGGMEGRRGDGEKSEDGGRLCEEVRCPLSASAQL